MNWKKDRRGIIRETFERAAKLECNNDMYAKLWARRLERIAEAAVQKDLERWW